MYEEDLKYGHSSGSESSSLMNSLRDRELTMRNYPNERNNSLDSQKELGYSNDNYRDDRIYSDVGVAKLR